MSASKASAPKSDLLIRTIAGIAMIGIALAALYSGGWPFRILVGAGAVLMFLEWCTMHKLCKPWPMLGAILLLITLWIVPMLFSEQQPDTRFPPIGMGFLLVAVSALALGMMGRSRRLAGGYLYVALPAFALLILHAISWQAVVWAMVVTWSTDIFAYFAGRGIGGPKLAPAISPNKTWAGLAGGMAGAAALGAVTAGRLGLDPIFLFLGAPMGLIAQLGDLYESAVKRRAGVKDSGTILPGHGGVLDRLDGLLPVILATLAVVAATRVAS